MVSNRYFSTGIPIAESEFEQRKKLRKQPLALWLLWFLSSHAAPYPLKINTIHRLSESGAQTLRDFKYRMRKALEALVAIGAIDSFVPPLKKGD